MAWLIYLIGIVDNLIGVLGIIAGTSMIAAIISSIVRITNEDYGPDKRLGDITKRWQKISILTAGITLIIIPFIPSSQTIAAMYLIPKIAENESLNQIPEKALNILNLKLDQWGKELVGGEKK